jgi:H+/Cl- antiporter ClcA
MAYATTDAFKLGTMKKTGIKNFFSRANGTFSIFYLIKWILLTGIIGFLVGSASAFFLVSLDWATNWRENHTWIIAFLPLSGLLIGLMYHYFGNSVVKGNNLLIEEFHNPKQIIPLKMAPLVLAGTIITHFFGGSAGREGTAVQMGGAIADQFTHLFRLSKEDRKIILTVGISAGFASIFGTPLAGAVFALEVMILGSIRYEAIVPSFLAAVIADYFCHFWNISHTKYTISTVSQMNPQNLLWAVFAGIIFGLVSNLFSKSIHFWTRLFHAKINYPPLRPLIGGIVIAVAVWAVGSTKYIGLGIPSIVESFSIQMPQYDFIAKILFTSFTIGAGFKGGEVTPLFFIGATLGNALIWIIPLPLGLLAGMGFVAVFAGATNTPIACTLMGLELFGIESGVFIAIACIISYLFSGHSGVYSSQIVGSPKHLVFGLLKGKSLSDINKKNTKL